MGRTSGWQARHVARRRSPVPAIQRLEPRLALAHWSEWLPSAGGRTMRVATLADTTPPVIRTVGVPAPRSYAAGATLSFTLTFNEQVEVAGVPALPVRIGTTTRSVPYQSGSGGKTLTFSTQVLPGESDHDGIELLGGPASTPEVAIRDLFGNVAAGNLPARRPGTGGVRVDGVRPVLLGLSDPQLILKNRAVSVAASFSEPIVVRGRPTVPLLVGGIERQATLTAVKGTTATFIYRAAKNETLGSPIVRPLTLPDSATVADRAGNAAAFDDWGDLPSPHATLATDGGPAHRVGAALFLGGVRPDADADGQPSATSDGDEVGGTADEDAIDPAAVVCVLGAPLGVSVRATNLTGRVARMCGFIDWNTDGDFADPDERFVVTVPDGSDQTMFPLPVTVPATASKTTPIPLRLRLASILSPTEPNLGAGDAARDGEVEDVLLDPAVDPLDFGDLPEPAYATRLAADGPRHVIVAGLRIGTTIDQERDGAPASHALGDDAAGVDDEDGFDPAAVTPVPGAPLAYAVRVTTPAGPGAILYGFTDWNDDGDFDDVGERSTAAVAGGETDADVTLSWYVPATAVVGEKLAVRLRLVGRDPTGGQQPPLGPGGLASSGEVEDSHVFIPTGAEDFGDLPAAAETPFVGPTIDPLTCTTLDIGRYGTTAASFVDAPRNRIRPDLFLGTSQSPVPVDGEADGQPDPLALGDDAAGDDEDGVTFGGISAAIVDNVTPTSADAVVSVTAVVSVKNETGSPALCSGLFVLDKDGIAPLGVTGGLTVPSQPGFTSLTYNFSQLLRVSALVKETVLSAAFRFRVSTETEVGIEQFARFYALRDGETEDAIVPLSLVFGEWWTGSYLDFGDLDSSRYATTSGQDGARHRVVLGQQSTYLGGLAPDGDLDGKGSVLADGDDAAGIDDEDGVYPGSIRLTAGMAGEFAVSVTSAAAATLYGFIDFNGDGSFTGPGETSSVAVPAGSSAATVSLPWNVPADAVTGRAVGVRLRISTAAGLSATGLAPDGEVEDYLVTVSQRSDGGR